MTDIQLEVDGADRIKTMLSELGLDVKDLRGAMNAVGNNTTKYFSGQVFASRGSTIGLPWQRLSDRYAAYKSKKFGGKPLLVRSGTMQRSFKHQVGSDNMSVEISNTAKYFKYHQSSETRYNLPRRAMIGIYGTLQSDVTAVIGKVLAEKIKKRAG